MNSAHTRRGFAPILILIILAVIIGSITHCDVTHARKKADRGLVMSHTPGGPTR